MKEILCKLSKETRCYIMAAKMFFEGFDEIDYMTEISGEMSLDVLGLTKDDMERFPVPDYSQLVSHLSPITDPEVRHWIITNTYSPVLKCQRADALRTFRKFCSDLRWDSNEVKESLELTEELDGIKPIRIDNNSLGNVQRSTGSTTNGSGSGCIYVFALIIVSTLLCSYLFF